jgi:hypothetical protein
MSGLGPGIHEGKFVAARGFVDGPVKPGHDARVDRCAFARAAAEEGAAIQRRRS